MAPSSLPLLSMARMLKALGVDADDLKASLTVNLALNSARLGYPIATILLSKEPSAAVKVLHRCMQVTPSVSFIEFQKMTQEDLFLGSPQIRERTVTSSDENGFKKVRQDVDLLLSRGNSTTQELIRSKFGVGLQSRRVEIPLSLVGVASDRASSVLQHPSLLWVSVEENRRRLLLKLLGWATGRETPSWTSKSQGFRRPSRGCAGIPWKFPLRNRSWAP